MHIQLQVNGASFTAALEQNAAAQALAQLLAQGPVTIQMDNYGGFEKVGALGQSLPASDVQTTTGPGDIVLDPFSGSGTTLVVAQQLQRLWIGCEKEGEYNTWAMDRIDRVPLRPVEAWMELDRENARRRESIR